MAASLCTARFPLRRKKAGRGHPARCTARQWYLPDRKHPQISDVSLIFDILTDLGAEVRSVNAHAVEINCEHIRSTRTPYELARRIRASYYMIGALLGRFGRAEVTMPGGCNFGVRPIDQHIKGFAAMGAEVEVEGGFIHARATEGHLHGAQVYLDVVSVGATMNVMLAAVLADGNTVIENAAKEPHIVDLANFLNSMALISAAPAPT